VTAVADHDSRVLVTKDTDFLNTHLLAGKPARLLLVSTGNISTGDLERLVVSSLPELVRSFDTAVFIELTRTAIVVHGG
jgi:predicted nuclease of predicted toxin-antitoxin system